MYNKFYGFSESPFATTPNPRFYYLTSSHREAVDSIIQGLDDRSRLIVLTGASGTGKTTFVYHLVSCLRRNDKTKVISIFCPSPDFRRLLETFLTQLGIKPVARTAHGRLRQFASYLAGVDFRSNVLAIIDEADKLPEVAMREAMILFDLQPKALQMLWVGQPDLEEKLDSAGLSEVKDRVGTKYRISPLTERESQEYIGHRLALVGRTNSEPFTPESISLICRCAKGSPRVLNILCDNALLVGHALSRGKIDLTIAREVINTMEGHTPGKTPRYSTTLLRTLDPQGTKLHSSTPSASTLDFFRPKTISLFRGLARDRRIRIGDDSRGKHHLKAIDEVSEKIEQTISDKHPSASLNSGLHRSQNLRTRSHAPKRRFFPPIFLLLCLTVGVALLSTYVLRPPITPPRPFNVPAPLVSTAVPAILDEVVVVERGQSLWSLARRYCHAANEAVIDLILDSNPEITNAHRIEVNQKIKIPRIREELLITQSDELSYAIRVGTFDAPGFARFYTDEPVLKGKVIEVSPRKISSQEIWYRVLIGPFDEKDKALKMLGELKEKGLLPAFGATLKLTE